MRFIDKAAACLVCLFGLAHLAVGHAAFLAPTERRVWLASAGFLLIVTGLVYFAAQAQPTRLNGLTAAVASASILVLGTLLAVATAGLLTQPQTVVLLAVGLLLTVRRLRDLTVPRARSAVVL